MGAITTNRSIATRLMVPFHILVFFILPLLAITKDPSSKFPLPSLSQYDIQCRETLLPKKPFQFSPFLIFVIDSNGNNGQRQSDVLNDLLGEGRSIDLTWQRIVEGFILVHISILVTFLVTAITDLLCFLLDLSPGVSTVFFFCIFLHGKD